MQCNWSRIAISVKHGACALVLGSLATSASSLTIEAKINISEDRTHDTTSTLKEGFDTNSLPGYAGRFNAKVLPGQSGNAADIPEFIGDTNGFWTWCIEPLEYINASSDDYTVKNLEASKFAQLDSSSPEPEGGRKRKDDLAALFGGLLNLEDGTIKTGVKDDGNLTSPRDYMTAFQLALWEIVQENGQGPDGLRYSVGLDGFSAVVDNSNATNIVAQANLWLAAILDPDVNVFDAESALDFWVLDTSPDGQSQIAISSISVIPLPAAVWMFGSGLLLIAGVGRRRNRPRND